MGEPASEFETSFAPLLLKISSLINFARGDYSSQRSFMPSIRQTILNHSQYLTRGRLHAPISILRSSSVQQSER